MGAAWRIVWGMKRKRQRKCRHCGDLYEPDYRNGYHQRYCSRPACRTASRLASQARWLSGKGCGYHHGEVHVLRVQAWRQAHPGYGRSKGGALQDDCLLQPAVEEELTRRLTTLAEPEPAVADLSQAAPGQGVASISPRVAGSGQPRPLQDLWLSQHPVFVGLVSFLTGALQEDMAPTLARLQSRGRAILRQGPGFAGKGV